MAVGEIIAGAIGGTVDAGISLMNYGNQLEYQDYMKRMQKEAWAREDTAIQRRVADLKAAGLNPILAAGQGAVSSNPVQVSPPQMQEGAGGRAAKTAFDVMLMKLGMDKAKADALQTEALAKKADAEARVADATADSIISQRNANADVDVRTVEPRVGVAYANAERAQILRDSDRMALDFARDTNPARARALLLANDKLTEEIANLKAEKLMQAAQLTGQELANARSKLENYLRRNTSGPVDLVGAKFDLAVKQYAAIEKFMNVRKLSFEDATRLFDKINSEMRASISTFTSVLK